MIFLIDYDNDPEVLVYESLDDLTSRVEWQDVQDGHNSIIDEKGNKYKWDLDKKEEIGTVYGYSLIPYETDTVLALQCTLAHAALKRPSEFKLSKNDSISEQVKIKNNRIKELLFHLIQTYGCNAFKVKDHWNDDDGAIGLVDTDEECLIYISAIKGADSYYVALENPPIDSDTYKPAGDFNHLNLKELEAKFEEHLRAVKL